MVIIELSKLNEIMKKPVDKLSAFEMWSIFLKFSPEPMHRPLINDIIKAKEEIGMATSLLREISKDEHERARLRSRRMWETDRISDLLTSEEIGEIREREKWQSIVADKDAKLADNEAKLADKDAKLADKDAEIARLKAELEKRQ